MKLTIKNLVKSSIALVAAGLLVTHSASAQLVETIAVGDVTFSAKGDDGVSSKSAVIADIDTALNKALLNTRKFYVMTYAQLNTRLAKQGIDLQDYYNTDHKDSRYIQVGLDYILTTDVVEMGIFEQERGDSTASTALVEIDFRLIGVADLTADIVSSVSVQLPAPSDANQEVVLQSAVTQAVDQLVDQVVAALFPIRVMEIAGDGQVKLNYGAGLFAPGDTVMIFPKGDAVSVNQAGQVVGEAIATLRITSVETKFADAQALEGFSELEKGQRGQLLSDG